MGASAPFEEFSLRCPAKLNLFLEVLAKRPDGYHEIETVTVPFAGLRDTLAVRPAPRGVLDLEVAADPAWGIPGGEGNLVHRAARAVLDAADPPYGLRLRLEKRIPPGAGLGGGSSDAGTFLRAASLLPGPPVPRKRLEEIALSLGSDVPFFLDGDPAVGRGRGERLEPIGNARRFWFVVAWPGSPAPTAEVYARCRPAAAGTRRDPADVLAALRSGDPGALARSCFNRLAAASRAVCPGVADAFLALEDLGYGAPKVTGSGSACFLVLPRGVLGPSLAGRLKGRLPGGSLVVGEA